MHETARSSFPFAEKFPEWARFQIAHGIETLNSLPVRRQLRNYRAVRAEPQARATIRRAADLLAIADADAPEERRMEAAARVAQDFDKPIHPRRWSAVSSVLNEEAAAHGRNPATELEKRVVAAIFPAVTDTLKPSKMGCDGISMGEVCSSIRTELNRALSTDILGPDWRRDKTPLTANEAGPANRPDEELELLLCLERSGLQGRDLQAALAISRGANAPRKLAIALGISSTHARQLFHRLRKSLIASEKS